MSTDLSKPSGIPALIRPLAKSPIVFVQVALDRKSANLGMARMQVKAVEAEMKM